VLYPLSYGRNIPEALVYRAFAEVAALRVPDANRVEIRVSA
jgi:hypothetical protein